MYKKARPKGELSDRQIEVAMLVTQGLSNREVADALFVSEKTVKFHMTDIFKRTGYASRAQLTYGYHKNKSFYKEA